MAKPTAALQKLENEVVDNVCKNLIEGRSIAKDLKKVLNVRLTDGVIEQIRDEALSKFKEITLAEFEKIHEDEKITEKLIFLKSNTNKKAKNGWRPSGDPRLDTFGARRKILVEHVEKLEDLKDTYERELQKITDEISSSGK